MSNPFWDGDGVQGAGQPRDPRSGRWVDRHTTLPSVYHDFKGVEGKGKVVPLEPGKSRWGHGGTFFVTDDHKTQVSRSSQGRVFYGDFEVFEVKDDLNGSAAIWNGGSEDKKWNSLVRRVMKKSGLSGRLFDHGFNERQPFYAALRKELESEGFDGVWVGGEVIIWNFDKLKKPERIKKAIPLWDGDGVQGAGQPRNRLGRWIRLPGPTARKKIGAWELEDGTWGVFVDGEEEPRKIYKTKKGANDHIARGIKEDAKAYAEKEFREKEAPKARRAHAEHQKEREERQRQILAEQAEAAASRRRAPVASPSPGKSKPAPRSMRMTTDPLARIELPGKPTLDQRNKANAWAKENLPDSEAKYAGLIARLAGKGISQDPAKRGEMSQKYGIPAGRLVQIEQEVYAQMFPTKTSRERRRNLGGGASATNDIQKREMLKHGALKAIAMSPGKDGNPNTPSRFFKATKGEHKGKYVKVSWNGTAEVMSDDDAIDAIYESKIYWANYNLRSAQRMARMRTKRQQENRALREKVGEDAAAIKAEKIAAAQRWAEEQGYDPDDSFWWGFFWNDASLIKSQKDDVAEGTKELTVQLGEVMEHEKMDPRLLEGILALPDDISSRRMRGHRPGSKRALPGDEDFIEASPESRSVDPEWEARNRDRQVVHERRIKAAYDRYKKKHPNSKLTYEEFQEQYYNNRLRIPGGGGRGISKANPLWDGDGVQGVGQPRGARGRWTDTGRGTLSAVARSLDLAEAGARQHTGSRSTKTHTAAGGSARRAKTLGVATAFDHREKTIAVKPPRPNRGAKLWYEGILPDSKRIDNGKALYQRNNGPTAITNARLKQIFDDPSKMTAKEKVLIVSARSAKSIDGESMIKGVNTSRGKRDMPRYELMGQLASKITPGSGNRSARRESGPSEERRQKINEKRQASGKVSAPQFKKIQDDIIEKWSLDGKTALCVFCGKQVRNTAMSIETPKPKELGGGYTPGNVMPSHKTCNTAAGKKAQADPQLYYVEMMRMFKKRVPKEVKKNLKDFYKEHRKYLGSYTAAKQNGFK